MIKRAGGGTVSDRPEQGMRARQATTLTCLAVLALLVASCATGPAPTVSVPTLAPATVTRPSTPAATPTARPTLAPTGTPTPTTTPSPTPTPPPLPGAGWITFESTRDGNAEIYLLDSRSGDLTNLTRHPADDRTPAWRPDGGAIALESNRDGNWELYVQELATGVLTRLTEDLAYDGAPAWSPDGSQIAFESYRDGNLEIYTVPVHGGQPRRLTDNPAGDFGPAWSPDGDSIAFTSWRDGDKEVYLVAAQGGEARNLTQNPADDEDPAWSPDGSSLAFTRWEVDPKSGNRNAEIFRLVLADGSAQRLTQNPWPDVDPAWDRGGHLVWAAYDPGVPFETYDPYRPGAYHLVRTTPSLRAAAPQEDPLRLTQGRADDRRPACAPAHVPNLDRLGEVLAPLPPAPTPEPKLAPGTLAQVVEVSSILASPGGPPILVNELVVPSLVAWQQDVLAASGWDLLHVTHGSWRTIDQFKQTPYAHNYGFLSWHKTGRALDGPFEYLVEGADQMVVAREDLAGTTFWRIYLRTARQDGTQGQPLKDSPWLFWWRIVPEEEPQAYAAGGKRLAIPAGYYVDVTAIARRHGWDRIATYAIEGDYDWHTSSNGTEYWHYERSDGLLWWDAMQQIYELKTLLHQVGWEVGLKKAQSQEMMRSKGVPTPAP